jgi:hypothetical protein
MLHTHQNNVVGLFTEEAQAVRTQDELVRAGFPAEQIELSLVRGEQAAALPATNTGPPRERALGGAVTGGIVGAIVCGLLGTLAATGWMGGSALVFDGGALSAVVGAAVGIVAGALLGGLIGWAFLSTSTDFYTRELQTGRYVVTVHADGRTSEAAAILRRHNAQVSP